MDGFLRAMRERARDANTAPNAGAGAITLAHTFDDFPQDILDALVPYLLTGHASAKSALLRRFDEPYGWANGDYWARQFMSGCRERLVRVRDGREIPVHVLESAALPALRVELVCKRMQLSLISHMAKLLEPRNLTEPAAAKIIHAFTGYTLRHKTGLLPQMYWRALDARLKRRGPLHGGLTTPEWDPIPFLALLALT
jgi:hypothetical protein